MTGSIAIQRFLWAGAGALLLVPLFSCRLTPKSHRMTADSGAFAQIEDAQRRAVGRVEPIGVETPADTLRRRLLLDQLLPHGGIVSLGVRDLPDNEYWNKERDLLPPLASSPLPGMKGQWTVSLVQALQVAAAGSRDFQRAKDDLFRAALDLDLEANAFRTTFTGMFKQLLDSSHGGGGRDTASRTSVEAGAKRVFKNGVQLTSAIALDLVELLTQEKGVSTGVRMDASISIPLLRGSGRRVVMEPLTQAQRNLLYRVYEFERYKRTFAVAVASDYFAVLLQKRKVGNQEENYKRVIASTRRARRLADSGRLPEFQFDQSVQDELSARNSWIRARQAYASKLDGFKLLIGVSPDANLVLAEGDLAILQKRALQLTEGARMADYSGEIPPADAPVKLREPSREKLGTYELDSRRAIETALGKRMDLRVREARVEDAQRGVYMAVDGLRAEITLLGKAGMGGRRSVGQSGSENAK
ncbi:MAG: TolC family protein, partial [Lentisphaeria bacterium]|nr:TolC family protein [Lentisphaeria bacterium]